LLGFSLKKLKKKILGFWGWEGEGERYLAIKINQKVSGKGYG